MEEREQKLEKVKEERRLLPQRYLVFLSTSSILFVGFTTLESFFLKIVVAGIGLLTCFPVWFHFRPIHRELNQLEKESRQVTEKRKWYEKPFGGRRIYTWFLAVFGTLWLLSLIATVKHWV